MRVVVLAGPATEPVSLERVKQYLRIEHADDDELLRLAIVPAARRAIESVTGQVLGVQRLRYERDGWPRQRRVRLPRVPARRVTAAEAIREDGSAFALDASRLRLVGDDAVHDPLGWPCDGLGDPVGLAIEYEAGLDPVPEPLAMAVLLLAAHWYEQRLPVAVGAAPHDVPWTVASLVTPYRRWFADADRTA